jgi:hypothetical protein
MGKDPLRNHQTPPAHGKIHDVGTVPRIKMGTGSDIP